MVEGCTRSQVETAFAKSQLAAPARSAYAILTETEVESLVKWLHGCAKNDPLNRPRLAGRHDARRGAQVGG